MYFDPNAFETVTTKRQLEGWKRRLRAAPIICADTETTGLDVFHDSLVGFAFAVDSETAEGRIDACYIPLAHHKGSQLSTGDVLTAVAPILATKRTLWHNALYDALILSQPRYDVKLHDVHDSMYMSYALTGSLYPQGHGMDWLALRYLKYRTAKFSDVVIPRLGMVDFRDVDIATATHYAAEDTAVTLMLARVLQHALVQEGLWDVYNEDRKLIPVIADMKRRGIKIDVEKLGQLGAEWDDECTRLEAAAHEAAGKTFKLGSPKQVAEVLYQERGLSVPKYTDSGLESTDKDALEGLAGDEVVDNILAWRKLSKLRSAFSSTLPTKADERFRVHPDLRPVRTKTRRFSCADPNTQQIPVRTKAGRQLREAFIAERGHLLIACDYSQIEYRVLAHITGQADLIQAFHDGVDVHAAVYAKLMGLPVERVTKDQRGTGKTLNFASIYGAGPRRVAATAKIDVHRARAMLDSYWSELPDVLVWKERTLDFAREHGFVETIFGGRIHVPGILSKDSDIRSGAERLAINAPIQGSAADLMRRAMVAVHGALPSDCYMLLQVHDELIVEAPEHKASDVAEIVKYEMEHAADGVIAWRVPIIAEANVGRTWLEAK